MDWAAALMAEGDLKVWYPPEYHTKSSLKSSGIPPKKTYTIANRKNRWKLLHYWYHESSDKIKLVRLNHKISWNLNYCSYLYAHTYMCVPFPRAHVYLSVCLLACLPVCHLVNLDPRILRYTRSKKEMIQPQEDPNTLTYLGPLNLKRG